MLFSLPQMPEQTVVIKIVENLLLKLKKLKLINSKENKFINTLNQVVLKEMFEK